MTKCTPTKKARIFQMRQLGTEFTDIANQLNLDVSTVRQNYKKVRKTEDFYAKPSRPGRPRVLGPRALRCAEQAITSGQARDGADVRRQLFPNVGASTMCRNLSEIGLKGCMRRKKPLFTKVHIKKRKLWAQHYSNWTVDDWKTAVFSDESKFNLFGSDGCLYCRRRPGEEFLPQNIQKTVKHGGGSLQVWGCLTWNGTGHLHRINGHMDCCCSAVQCYCFASQAFGLCQSNPQGSCALPVDLCLEIMWFACWFVSLDHMLHFVSLCLLFTVLCLRHSYCSLMYI